MPSCVLATTSDADWAIITDLVVILASAAVVAIVRQRVRLAAIPAYLIAGAVIGPRALGLIPSPEGLGAISHLAIILLLFGIGLELHLSVLKHRLARMITVGFGSAHVRGAPTASTGHFHSGKNQSRQQTGGPHGGRCQFGYG